MEPRALPGLGSGLGTSPITVSTRSASAQVAGILRVEIQRGDHAPGARLRQRDVAARLGVSTTPVREAFQVLDAEGFLRIESHRGAVVVAPSVADIEEGYAIRSALEALAVRECAAAFRPEHLADLTTLLERMRRASERDKWAALDHEFHRRLNEMSGMPRLLGLIDQLRAGAAHYVEAAFEDPAQREIADRDHVEILDACSTHDAELAETLIRRHLATTARAVVASIPTAQG